MDIKKYSVYILTYNEESKIRDCLESVKWADEIVVVDSFSTDKTVEICREYTDKIIQIKFNGFGELRNQAIKHLKYDWVLSVDADERVTEELRKEINEELKHPKADAYFIPRKSHFLNYWIKHCGWYPDYRQPQLFNKNKMKYKDQLVHESYILEGKHSFLKEHVLQYPFLNLDQFFKKMDRYSSLRAQEMSKTNKNVGITNIIFNPLSMFLRMYILKRGFLDGRVGFMLSALYSYYTAIKYIKLWEVKQKK